MEIRHATHPDQIRHFGTEELRAHYLVEDLFPAGQVRAVYSHHDRMVVAGTSPAPGEPVPLPTFDALRSEYFLERRELGVVALGAPGTVQVDGEKHQLGDKDALYVGRGAREVVFSSDGPEPARFYLVSTAAHTTCPTRIARFADSKGTALGARESSNERTIHRLIHEDGIRSCELVLGVTVLEPGSMWNTLPCHTHDRRTEVYLYTGLPENERVVHLLGRPDETRNLIVADGQAVISPSWSVHFGFGTRSYAFVWAMGGENQAYTDMEPVAVPDLR
ncbi:5-dehydro-4-deoxy-D-glucuronate isomerase [Streptomyces sp. NPDC005408]|uniref:5-dehydro-4-deoxy-D-glucuronate isomerase n=1 Tax=Streptomyces sp. NPDC005408 TaxID=3155341 RepID=UPI0033B0B9DF